MPVEDVGEIIDVLAVFRDGRFEPRKFKWRGRAHKIGRVNGRWAEHDGKYRVYHFAVVSDSDSFYELSLRTKSMEWTLDRFMVGEG